MPPQTRSTKQAGSTNEAGPSSMQSEIESQLETDAQQAQAKQATKAERREDAERGPSIGGLRLPMPGNLLSEPAGKRLLWIGGLGAMATLGLLEWPVAVAVGAGSLIAERLARQSGHQRPPRANAD